MAKKSKSKKAGKGKPVKAAKKTSKVSKVKSKPKVGQKVKAVLTTALSEVPGGQTAMELYQQVKPSKKASVSGLRKRRRGVVPKTVKKWASRYARKRKQTEKVIKNVFGSDGSKLLGSRRRRSYGGSPGVITSAEVREAMRR